jgi:cytochrome P450 enzyme
MSNEALVFNPTDPGYLADPYPVYRRLRNEAPVHWWEHGHMWLLSRHADVEATLKDPRFSVDVRKWRLHDARVSGALPPEVVRSSENGLFQVSPADHTRIRKLVSGSFTPRAAATREQLVQEVVDELLSTIDPQAGFDLVPDFADHLPIRVISRMLGIPREHEAAFREWGQGLVQVTFPVLPPDEYMAVAQRLPAGYRLMERVIEERRATPGDDLLTSLIQAQEQGERLSLVELVSLVAGLVTAGSETTVHLLAFAMHELLRHPEVRARATAEPEVLTRVIEEVLRHDNFGSLGVPRYALEDVELRGQAIAKGDMVMCMLGAAMHDEAVWPDAERFDIDREPVPNLSFGRGPHFCLGAHLARAEARVALRTLLERYPGLELAGPVTFRPHPFIRQMASLPLRVAAKA